MTTCVEYRAIPFIVSNDFFIKAERESYLGGIICMACPGRLLKSYRRQAARHGADMPP